MNTCRCGYERSGAGAEEDRDAARARPGVHVPRALLEGLALVALTAGVGYYYFGGLAAGKPAAVDTATTTAPVMHSRPAPVAATAAPAASEPPSASDVETAKSQPASLEDVISNAMPALVRVETSSGFGSGFFVRADTVLTNVHVVAGNTVVTVKRPDGSALLAHVERTASAYDIAILRIASANPSQPTLTMGSGIRARAGQEVVAIGTPLGLQNTVTRGIVSAVRVAGAVSLVQTDAAINPGNSGGPLLDRNGQVIAIATMTVRPGVGQGLSFGVAIDHARALLDGQLAADTAGLSPGGLAQAFAQPSPPPGGGTSAPSAVDAARERGTREFERTMGQLARVADSLDDRWRSFMKACYYGQVAGTFERPWFALYDPRAMQGTVANACDAAFSDIRQTADRIRTEMQSADEAARRADVYPGARRDVLRKHRLDYAGWVR